MNLDGEITSKVINHFTDKGIINVSKIREHHLNRPKNPKRCEGYEARWDHHKEWLHTIDNPIYFRINGCCISRTFIPSNPLPLLKFASIGDSALKSLLMKQP